MLRFGVRLLFGLRQGTGGGEAKAGHPLKGTRRNLVCLLCLFYFQASCYIVSTKSDGLEAALGGARASNREALVSCKDRAHSFKRMDGAAHLRGTGGLFPPQAPSKAKQRVGLRVAWTSLKALQKEERESKLFTSL